MNKVLEYIIRAKDATGDAVSSAMSKVKNLAIGIGTNLMNIKAGFEMLGGAVRSALSVLEKSFKFETMTIQFKTLTKSIDEARAHMADLKELGDTPPFSLEQFAAASRSLMVMTEGALGYKNSLQMIGDAAAATGTPIEQMGHAVGRLYSFIRDGQPLSRATMELRNMGVITPEVAAKLDDMQKAGRSNIEIWGEVEKQLQRYNGAMKETENTGEGLAGAIKTRWDNAVRTFGDAFMDSAKGGMQTLLDKLKELEESGTLQEWGEKVAQACSKVITALGEVKDFCKDLGGWIGGLFTNLRDSLEVEGERIGAFIGALRGGASLSEARSMASEAGMKADVEKKGKEWADKNLKKLDLDGMKRQENEAKRSADEDAKKDEEERKARSERERIQEQLREGEEKRRKAEAAESEKKRQKELEKPDKEWEKAQKEFNKKQAIDQLQGDIDQERENAQREANRINQNIERLVQEIADIERRRENTSRGMANDNARHGWNPYQYHFDRNGNIDFIDWQRAQRYGPLSEAEKRAQRRQEAEDRRMQELENKWKDGKKLSDREMEKLGKWWDFKDERDGKAAREKQIEELRKKAQQAAINSEKHLKELRDKVKKIADEGPLD